MNKLTASLVQMNLKKGSYFVCDPCYVYPDKEWSNFCEIFFAAEKSRKHENGVKMTYAEIDFFVCDTAYGDGYILFIKIKKELVS